MMILKTMFILMSHKITLNQKEDAVQNWGVSRFVTMPTDVWSQIPAEADSVVPYLEDIKPLLVKEATPGDLLLVQGDFGATFNMVQYAKEIGMTPVYATTRRKSYEKVEGERVIVVREFEHVRFRKYEG